MADPIKYVQLDCHLDEKFEYIEAEFGLEGFAIIVKLLQRIYGGQGYYCEWSDRVALLFAKKIGAGANVVQEVVASALRERIFDQKMYQKYGVLTSHGIQKRFAEVAKRRMVIFDKPEYVIGSYAQISAYVCNSSRNARNEGRNVYNEPLSEVNKSKAKQSEVKVSEVGAAAPAASPPHADLDVRSQLIEEYGEKNVEDYEQHFDSWKAAKGGNIKVDKYATIAKWLQEDGVIKKTSIDYDKLKQTAEIMARLRNQYANLRELNPNKKMRGADNE